MYYITIKGSSDSDITKTLNDNNEVIQESIHLEAWGIQPVLIEESDQYNFWGGGIRKFKKFRLKFNIKLKDFDVIPQDTFAIDVDNNLVQSSHNQTFMDYIYLNKILSMDYLWIGGFDANPTTGNLDQNFQRLIFSDQYGNGTNGLIDNFYPVELGSISELSADFEKGIDQTTLSLLGKQWYDFSTIPTPASPNEEPTILSKY